MMRWRTPFVLGGNGHDDHVARHQRGDDAIGVAQVVQRRQHRALTDAARRTGDGLGQLRALRRLIVSSKRERGAVRGSKAVSGSSR